jgi:uncharacterized protein (DUF433 family)
MSAQVEQITYAYQTPEGGWRVSGSRVSIDSIIFAYWDGRAPEEIRWMYPTLSLEQIHGAIACYLHHQEMFDEYMKRQQERLEKLRAEWEPRNRELRARIRQRVEDRQASQNQDEVS